MIIPIKKIILEALQGQGSIRVYHGTSPEYKEDILQNGMKISGAGLAGATAGLYGLSKIGD